ncbi:hypothetical protein AB6A40_004019 [Gnathostoma spinigerum]|uniref:Rab-GAP TBC domain-containing protein n=1 Tax=Gnathostoma spinigerum TaxID=75299 RepID=A0ABD6EM05_9BILA
MASSGNYRTPITSGEEHRTAHQLSFADEWAELFGKEVQLSKIQRCCLGGRLRGSRVRSIVWRILLKALPIERSEWCTILTRSRNAYIELKAKVITNPRQDASSLDPELSNPLSLRSDNPWRQYFADEELRDCINRDVERTFPELQFFRDPAKRKVMSDVLFVYGKKNPHIAYKQGMHEILAPLIFVICFDQQAFDHAAETDSLRNLPSEDVSILKLLNDSLYLEHDAFELFSQLMMLLESWYISAEEKQRRSNDELFSNDVVQSFSEVLEIGPTNELSEKLKKIDEEIFAEVDPVLRKHLAEMEIAPQIYGIRWLRLLFGREFPVHDLLFLWDAIFAFPPPLVLVDYIFVAMLVQIRDLLLASDYSAALQYLMRYPPAVDVHSFVQLALHIKSPKKFGKPRISGLTNFANITVAGRSHPNLQRDDFGDHFPLSQVARKVSISERGTNERRKIESFVTKIAESVTENRHSAQHNSFFPFFSSAAPVPMQELELLKDQVTCLQNRLNEVDLVGRIAAKRIDSCIGRVQSLEAKEESKREIEEELRSISDQLIRSTASEEWVRSIGIRDGTKERRGVEIAKEAGSPGQRSSSFSVPAVRRSIFGDSELVELKR